MAYAQIHNIFPIYEKQFYQYLVPYVVNDLSKKTIKTQKGFVMPVFKYANYIDASTQSLRHLIVNSTKAFFDYLFPIEVYPPLEKPRKDSTNSQTLAKNPSLSTRQHIIGSEIYLKLNNELNDQILSIIKQKKPALKVSQESIDELRDHILNRPVQGIVNDKLKLKTRTSYDDFIKATRNLGLDKINRQDIIDKQYYKYQNRWEIKHHDNNKLSNAIKQFILNEVLTTPTHEIDKKELNELTYKIRSGSDTLSNVYNYYLEQRRIKLASQQHRNVKPFDSSMDINEFTSKIGYKGVNKRKALITANYGNNAFNSEQGINAVTNRFPLKDNQQYHLHTIAPRYSYIIDLMFENKELCYLVATNINTRKLWVESTNIKALPTNDEESIDEYMKKAKESLKSSENVMRALERMIQQGMKVRHLKGDGESAFKSAIMKRFYENHGIDFEEVQREPITKYPEFMFDNHMVKSIRNKNGYKTEPKHSSLGLNDRVIRTIRDLAFNMKVGVITPKVMKAIVWQYNNAPHATLSKFAGQPVSPNDVDNNKDLEEFIVKRMQQNNVNIIQSSGFNIKPGLKIKVYNEKNAMTKRRSNIEPGNFKVWKRRGPLFEVIDENTGEKEIKSRYQISQIWN